MFMADVEGICHAGKCYAVKNDHPLLASQVHGILTAPFCFELLVVEL
jgi:hypothetical protein